MLSKSYNVRLFSRLMQEADCAVVEGVMGLFDGFSPTSDTGSTAEMAKWLNLPVLLVVDAASMARSAAAVVKGFENFDREVGFAGVIFNRVGSKNHLSLLKEAVDRYCDTPCLGGLIRDGRLIMPERHLGLVTADEAALSRERVDYLAGIIEENLDLDELIQTCQIPVPDSAGEGFTRVEKKARIAVARDAAFCFYYPDNLELLESFSAELVFFSPLKDEEVPKGCHGIYIGGGYPEVFAKTLAKNEKMRESVRRAGEEGCPIYAECGGLMYLSREIATLSGTRYPMVGILPFSTRMLPRFRALGYREIRLTEEGPLGPPGTLARGHEFHYSEIQDMEAIPLETLYKIAGRKNRGFRNEGFRVHNVLASYIHLHFGSNLDIPRNWVNFCARRGFLT
jgi:cobyrinic acid a,c-diamide synthase